MSSTNVNQYQFYVLKLAESPCNSDIVSVPNTWIIEQPQPKIVIVKYPSEELSIANQRVGNKEEYDDGWNIYYGKVIYGTDNYSNSSEFITRYNNMKPNAFSFSTSSREETPSSTIDSTDSRANIDAEANLHKNSKYSNKNQTPTTSKRSLDDDTDSRKKIKKAVTVSTPCPDSDEDISEEDSDSDGRSSPNTNVDETPLQEANVANTEYSGLVGKYILLNQNRKVYEQPHLDSCLSGIPFNILCFTETGLRSDAPYVLDNFKVVSATNLSNSDDCGALILVKNDIVAIEREDIVKLSINSYFDFACAELQDHIILCVHRYSKSQQMHTKVLFRETVKQVLKLISNSGKKFVICGELKINFRGKSPESKSFVNLFRARETVHVFHKKPQSIYQSSNIFTNFDSVLTYDLSEKDCTSRWSLGVQYFMDA